MEMTRAYMRETAAHLAGLGFELKTEVDIKERDGVHIFERERHWLRRGEEEVFVLESVHYPDGEDRWFLTIEQFWGLTSGSFPMDSWKHRPDRVEFKYYAEPESGMGLSFVLQLPRGG